MDSFELNKIMGAVLGTLLFVMGAGFVAEAIYHPIEGRGPGYALPEPEVAEGGAAPADAAPQVPLGVLLASADATKGAAAVKKCAGCHNFGEGEGNKQGPHLYGVVGRPEGSISDFSYSDALMAHNAAGDIWTYENLNAFLTKPADYAPGTKMTFAGVRSPEERADILAYLQTLNAEPVPFPAAEEAAPAAAPADGAATAPAEGDAAAQAEAPAGGAAPAEGATPEEAIEPSEGGAAVETPANATETPSETQSETPVVGTPTTSGTQAAPPPPTSPAAPAATTTP